MTIHLNTQADLDRAIHALVEQDPRLKPVLKLAGMPALRRRDPGYAGLAAIVCGQQLSTASAAAIWARVSAAFDPFHHDALRRARAERLGRLGLSAAKIKTLKNLARELATERLNLETLTNEEADAAHNTLTALHGIGPWTADVYLLFCLGHGDAWPAGDLAVQEAVKIGLGSRRGRREGNGAAGGAVASDARRGGVSVVDLLPGTEKTRGRDRRTGKSERCFKQNARRKTDISEGKDNGSKTAGIEKMNSTDFIVARNDLQQCKTIETQLSDAAQLPDGALLIRIDRFAFTANNITYAVLGDRLKYWQLFPAPESFGNIPVWGFGDVIASRHPGISEGESLFGYFPMATHLVIEAADVSKRGLRDAAAHRQGVAPVYNIYARVSGDPAYAGRQGDYQALLRPLFMLSFLVDDFLAENEFYGARNVDALQRLQQDRVRSRTSVAYTTQGRPGDRTDLGGQCRFRSVARLLRRGRDLRPRDVDAVRPAGCVRRHGRQQRVARDAPSAFRRPDEIFRTDRAHPPRHVAGRAAIARAPSRSGSSPPTRSANAPRNGDRAGSKLDSATHGRALPRCSIHGSM